MVYKMYIVAYFVVKQIVMVWPDDTLDENVAMSVGIEHWEAPLLEPLVMMLWTWVTLSE